MVKAIYPSDLLKKQWELIDPFMPDPEHFGRPIEVDFHNVVNAIMYVTRTGCQWRYLPKSYPPKSTVHGYFMKWQEDGTWDRIHDTLFAKVRVKAGRKAAPTAGIIDSQTSKTTEQ